MPVVLRAHTSREGRTDYKLIGECYIHGIMEGEAIDIQVKEGISIQQFVLV